MPAVFRVSDAREWRYIIEAIATIVEEAAFVLKPEGLTLKALDEAKVSMVHLEIPSVAFEDYNVEGEVVVGVNFKEMKKVLKHAKKGDSVEYSISGNVLKITLKNKALRSFEMPLIEPTVERIPELKLEFDTRVKLLSDALDEAVRSAEVVADAVLFESTEDRRFRIYASGEKGEFESVFDEESGSLLEIEVKQPSKASYSLDYIGDIVKKASKVSDEAEISFSTGKPCKITFTIPFGGTLTYYVAPRTE